MNKNKGYTVKKLSFLRKAVIASTTISKKKNTIHFLTEVDISLIKKLINDYEKNKEIKISLTAYIVSCLSKTVLKHPEVNSFISGNRLIKLDSQTISILIEKEISHELIPEPLGIKDCEKLNCLDITDFIREAQLKKNEKLGSQNGLNWFNLIPGFLLKLFIRLADSNINMAIQYGKIAVTAMGMFSKEPFWCIPNGSPTILLTIGSIINRVIEVDDKFQSREHLCLTVSYDHDVVDGAPAARFINDLIEEIKSGNEIKKLI